MKLLFVDFNHSLGGGQTYIINNINELTKLGIKCWLIGNNPSNYFNKIGIPLENLFEVPNSYLKFRSIYKLINSVVYNNNINYVILNGNKAMYLAPFIKLKNKITVKHTNINLNTGYKFILSKHLIKIIMNKYISKVVALSNIQKNELISAGINKNKIHVIYNGVEEKYLHQKMNLNTDENEIIITEIGRLEDNKGQKQLIEVFIKLLEEFSNIKLWLVGEGDLEYINHLKKFIKDHGRDDEDIYFWGYQDNVKLILEKTSIFVLPSRNECLPISIIEAMACSLPIIASDVGGISELVDHEKNGFLIKGNSQMELYTYLKLVIKNKHLRNKMSRESYKKCVKNFMIKNSVKQLVQIMKI